LSNFFASCDPTITFSSHSYSTPLRVLATAPRGVLNLLLLRRYSTPSVLTSATINTGQATGWVLLASLLQ